jgi:hypothetical protein
MIRTAILALALACALSWGAVADDSVNWATATGSAAVKKAIDIIGHAPDVVAITHDDKIYKGVYTPGVPAGTAGTTTWTLQCDLAVAAAGAGVRARDATWRSALWPQIVSCFGNIYVVRKYNVTYQWCDPNPPNPNWHYKSGPELCVLEVNGAAATPKLMIRPQVRSWRDHCSWGFNFDSTAHDTSVNGYLFAVGGTTLYWGGGGAAVITADSDAGPNFTYVYSTNNGTNWSLINTPVGRTLGNDEYGRAIPAALPSGYRYSHILEFNGALYDCYGTYTTAPPFTFTPYPAGSPHTEPWGWFLMGKDANQIYRIGHSKKGDKNYVYATNAPGGAWSEVGGVAAPPNNGSVYWRGCAAISDNENVLHNGLYCTYSADLGGGNFESGVYRYSDPDGPAGPSPVAWAKCVSSGDARVFTGGIYIKKDEAIYVGTSNGVLRRPINAADKPDAGNPKAPDPS